MGDERRRDERQKLVSDLEVFDLERDALVGYLQNVSTGGMLLCSETPIPAQQYFFLEIRLRNEDAARFFDDGEDKFIRLEAKSLWCQKAELPSFFKVGFKLMNTSPASLLSLSFMMRRLGAEEVCD